MTCTRREFVGALGLGGCALAGGVRSPIRPVVPPLLVVFLRGGADGLSLVVPHGDPAYRAARPTTAVRRAIDLDGYFGLHPGLEPLLPWWRAGRLLVVPAAGWPGRPPSGHTPAQRRIDDRLARSDCLKADVGGWDTHVNQGSERGDFAARVHALGETLGRIDGPTVVVLSEFGRAVRENLCGGTHHGRAGALLAFGGTVRGGIGGSWPGLAADVVPVRADAEALLVQLAGARSASSAPSRIVSQSVRTRSHS